MIINKYKIDYTGGSFPDPKVFLKDSLFDNTKIYKDFLEKECYKLMPVQPDFNIKLEEKDQQKLIKDLSDIKSKINLEKNFTFIDVTYKIEIEMFHVAGLLINSKKKIIEYVDSMPAPQSEFVNQIFREFFENELSQFKYYGLEQIYGEQRYYEKAGIYDYIYPPPQNTENQLIGSSDYDDLKSDVNVKNFIENYNSLIGGTCIFWTYHIINKVVENNTTVVDFIQKADWYKSRSYLEIGLKVIKYIINEITNNVLNCVRLKLKN